MKFFFSSETSAQPCVELVVGRLMPSRPEDRCRGLPSCRGDNSLTSLFQLHLAVLLCPWGSGNGLPAPSPGMRFLGHPPAGKPPAPLLTGCKGFVAFQQEGDGGFIHLEKKQPPHSPSEALSLVAQQPPDWPHPMQQPQPSQPSLQMPLLCKNPLHSTPVAQK